MWSSNNVYKSSNAEGYKASTPPIPFILYTLCWGALYALCLSSIGAFKLSKDNNDKRNPVPTIDIIIQGKSNSDGNNNNTRTILLMKRKKDPFKST